MGIRFGESDGFLQFGKTEQRFGYEAKFSGIINETKTMEAGLPRPYNFNAF